MRFRLCVQAAVLALAVHGSAPLHAQSIWDKMKQAAQKADQQKKAQQQPTAAQPAAASRPNGYTVQGPMGTPELTAQLASQAGFLDVTGIKLGMPAREALQVLKAHNPLFKVTPQTYVHQLIPNQTLVSGIEAEIPVVADEVYEKYNIAFTMAPSAAYVLAVGREVHYPRGKQPTVAAAMQGMREKYGPESFAPRANPDSPSFMWVKDLQGNTITGSDAARFSEACISPFHAYRWTHGAADAVTTGYKIETASFGPQECGKFAAVAVYMQGETVQGQRDYLLNNLTVVAINYGMFKSATQATHEQYLAVQNGQEKKQMDKANQQKVAY